MDLKADSPSIPEMDDFALDDNPAGDPFGLRFNSNPLLPSLSFGSSNMHLNYRANLVGEKILNPAIHLCDLCHMPIIIYGRMIPCKHVFCFHCADKNAGAAVCPRCHDEAFKIEKCSLGTVFMCKTESCKRTYLSQRDLEAHIKHRHVRKDLSNRL